MGHGRDQSSMLRHSCVLAGSRGCNRLIGGFSLEGETLRFSQLARTQMACGPESNGE